MLLNTVNTIGASADPRVRLCDLRSGAFTHSLTGHNGSVMAVQWSTRYEHMLVTGGYGNCYVLHSFGWFEDMSNIPFASLGRIVPSEFGIYEKLQLALCP
jgi:WD40 repeat protein